MNQRTIEDKTSRPDREIYADVRARLGNDVSVDEQELSVKVSEGVVRLSGTAGNLSERQAASQDAWVAGTRKVIANDLVVSRWERNEWAKYIMILLGVGVCTDAT